MGNNGNSQYGLGQQTGITYNPDGSIYAGSPMQGYNNP
jgi:hypothetical protein